MAAIPFFVARGMVRTGVEHSAGTRVGAEGLQDQPWLCPVLEVGRCVCVCAGVGAQQGGVPDPSTLPSKLMQL